MRRLRARVSVAAVMGAAAACSGAGAESGVMTRDSAGVRIVESPVALATRALWSVATEPLVEVGLLEGDEAYQLSQVGAALRLSDGRIVIANGGTRELRFYDPGGKHLLSAGRQGEGPGEFSSLGAAYRLAGDTLVAYDFDLRRLSTFAPDGAFVRSVNVTLPSGFPTPVGPFGDGDWLFARGFAFIPGNNGATVVRDTLPYLRFAPDGTLRDSLFRIMGPEYYVRSENGSAFASSLPFGRNTATVVSGETFYSGFSDAYDIGRYRADGTLELRLRLRREPVPVTQADIDRQKADRLADASERWRPRIERLYQDIPFPVTFPAFQSLLTDAAGNLWVLDYARPGDDRRHWTVFAPDGRALGAVDTPPATRVLSVGDGYLLGVWQDDLDVEHVRLYRVDRGQS